MKKNLLLDQLSQEIDALREELTSMTQANGGDLQAPEIHELSMKLDTLIVKFLKVRQEAANSR